jgi:hypothetical protein
MDQIPNECYMFGNNKGKLCLIDCRLKFCQVKTGCKNCQKYLDWLKAPDGVKRNA